MHSAIRVSVERQRGCGFRKVGGIYLVSDGAMRDCGRLPLRLDACPTCGAGIKPARGWTWLDAGAMFRDVECRFLDEECVSCPLDRPEKIGRAGLIWIGEKFYPYVDDFISETTMMGLSRRISRVPNGFVVGETWVMVAHRKGAPVLCPECAARNGNPDPNCSRCGGNGLEMRPAIFGMHRPQRIEIVVDGTEPDEKIDNYLKRGLCPVLVVPDADTGDINA